MSNENCGLCTSTVIKESFYRKLFSRLQLRSKKWFTSIYFLQILTKLCRTPFIREHLSLNTFWFSYDKSAKKYNILEKLIRKKIQKNSMVNNNKIICACYMSSKWPIWRSLINQTTGGTSRIKFYTLLQTNIYKYCALLCNKVAKIHLQ